MFEQSLQPGSAFWDGPEIPLRNTEHRQQWHSAITGFYSATIGPTQGPHLMSGGVTQRKPAAGAAGEWVKAEVSEEWHILQQSRERGFFFLLADDESDR